MVLGGAKNADEGSGNLVGVTSNSQLHLQTS